MDTLWKQARFVVGVDYGEAREPHIIPMDERSVADSLAQDILGMPGVKRTIVGEVTPMGIRWDQ